MATTGGWLVVLEANECSVRLDLTVHAVKEGNQLVVQSVPAGLHYLTEGRLDPIPGLWFDLQPGQVLVFVFNEELERYDNVSPETTNEYEKLISSGAKIENLKTYNRNIDVGQNDRWVAWQKLTKHLKLDNIPPTIHPDEAIEPPANLSLEERGNWLRNQPTRFEQALFNTHQGNTDALLSEFEYVFINQFVNPTDSIALKRWNSLVQAFYNAGERGITKVPAFFISLVDLLLVQFALTFDAKLKPGYVAICGIANRVKIDLVSGAEYLIEDMIDSEIEGVVEKAQEFAAYLKQRGIVSE